MGFLVQGCTVSNSVCFFYAFSAFNIFVSIFFFFFGLFFCPFLFLCWITLLTWTHCLGFRYRTFWNMYNLFWIAFLFCFFFGLDFFSRLSITLTLYPFYFLFHDCFCNTLHIYPQFLLPLAKVYLFCGYNISLITNALIMPWTCRATFLHKLCHFPKVFCSLTHAQLV